MFQKFGFWELAIILMIALIIFGPGKLPEMGRAIGKSIREFKKSTRELAEDIEKAQDVDEAPSVKAKPEAKNAGTG